MFIFVDVSISVWYSVFVSMSMLHRSNEKDWKKKSRQERIKNNKIVIRTSHWKKRLHEVNQVGDQLVQFMINLINHLTS